MTYGNNNQPTSQPENKNSFIDTAIDNFKNITGMSANSKVKIVNKSELPNKTSKITISFIGEYPIKSNSNEVLVPTPLTAELFIDENKKLTKHQILEPKHDVIQALEEELNYLINDTKIQSTDSNNSISSKSLSKEFYIESDKDGKKHLKRSRFFSR